MKISKFVIVLSTILVTYTPITHASNTPEDLQKEIEAKSEKSKSFDEFREKAQQGYYKYQDGAIDRYVTYRDSVMTDFVKFMKKPWKKTQALPPTPKPIDNSVVPEFITLEEINKHKDTIPKKVIPPAPKPIKEPKPVINIDTVISPISPIIKEDTIVNKTPKKEIEKPVIGEKIKGNVFPLRIDIKGIIEIPPIKAIVQPTPFVLIETPDNVIITNKFEYTFFGTPIQININDSCRFSINSIDNIGIANVMEEITNNKNLNNTINDCLRMRNEYKLCDWAYLQSLIKLGNAFFAEKSNEATLLAGYLYCMSGYKMRFAYDNNNKIYILASCEQYITDIPYISLNTDNYRRYYIIGGKDNETIFICDYALPKEKEMSLFINEEPKFSKSETQLNKTLHSYPQINVEYNINKNLISFFNTYPVPLTEADPYSKWSYYAHTPLSNQVKESIYPTLRNAIAGKSEYEAVNILMDFIESYEYGYDETIWGFDRAFFPDETLFYPKSDCEDHAILLSRLVKDLIGLDVALLYYPGHLATAIHFNEVVNGDYIMCNDKRYTVCDPTIYYGKAGRTMKGVNNNDAYIILLSNEL